VIERVDEAGDRRPARRRRALPEPDRGPPDLLDELQEVAAAALGDGVAEHGGQQPDVAAELLRHRPIVSTG
jgi:hypothetical protein